MKFSGILCFIIINIESLGFVFLYPTVLQLRNKLLIILWLVVNGMGLPELFFEMMVLYDIRFPELFGSIHS